MRYDADHDDAKDTRLMRGKSIFGHGFAFPRSRSCSRVPSGCHQRDRSSSRTRTGRGPIVDAGPNREGGLRSSTTSNSEFRPGLRGILKHSQAPPRGILKHPQTPRAPPVARGRSSSRPGRVYNEAAILAGGAGSGLGRGRSISRPRDISTGRPRSTSRTASYGRSRSKSREPDRFISEHIDVEPQYLRFVQDHVASAFRNGATLLQTAYELFVKSMDPLDLPKICIANREDNTATPASITQYYSRDSRRLMIFKMLRLPTVPCAWAYWKGDWNYRLENRDRLVPPEERHYTTDDAGVAKFRADFIDFLQAKAAARGNMLYVPRGTVGFILGSQGRSQIKMEEEYGVKITAPRRAVQSNNFDVVPIFVEDNEQTAGKKKRGCVACMRNIKKMVNKVETRNGKLKFFRELP